MKLTSESLEQTNKIASDFAKTLKPGDVIALYGELGAGKTTFVQAVAQSLGIRRRIISPTYILVRNYPIPNTARSPLGGKTFSHIDLYRVQSHRDLRSVDLPEILEDPDNLTMIEWSEKAKDVLPKRRIDIHIVYKGKGQRELTIAISNP